MSVAACTDRQRKGLITSGSLIVSTLTQNARALGSNPALGKILSIFITPTKKIYFPTWVYSRNIHQHKCRHIALINVHFSDTKGLNPTPSISCLMDAFSIQCILFWNSMNSMVGLFLRGNDISMYLFI